MSRSFNKAPSNVGMMDSAFFVSRGELLKWVNQLLETNLTKVEQCANGATYCQILDTCHAPNVVPMHKVNWMARSDHEFIPNYKILQNAFDKLSIDRNIDVQKLIKGKYQDNLEFLQWMKCYWDATYQAGDHYDPIERREGKQLLEWAKPAGGGSQPASKPNSRVNSKQKPANVRPGAPSGPRVAGGGSKQPSRANNQLMEEVEDLKITVDGLESERDYYFTKLREIEILTQTLEGCETKIGVKELIDEVQKILYRENEEDGTSPNEENDVVLGERRHG